MSDYKRLVSYIYSYPGGVRDKNVGFAKAEVRSGQFKLSVSLKGVYTDAPETFGVYLMVDRDLQNAGRFRLLRIGNIIVNAGMGQYTDLLNPENINGSEYAFSDISGIAVARTDDRYYMMFSLWEDCVVTPENVIFAPENDIKGGKKETMEKTPDTKPGVFETDREEQPLEMSAKVQEPAETTMNTAEREEPVQAVEQLVEKEAENVLPEEEAVGKTEETEEKPVEEDAPETMADDLPEFVKRQIETDKREVVEPDTIHAAAAQQMIKPNMRQQAYAPGGGRSMGMQSSMQSRPAFRSPVMQNTRQNQQMPVREQRVADGFAKLFKNADFIDAFDDDYYYDCVEVSPEVLKTLPIEDEAIINNSFLVHGYYNFKHILFGRVRENDNNTRYFIGVPGMYCNRERFMASMFGFNNFKKSHRSDYTNPYFGYWYQEI